MKKQARFDRLGNRIKPPKGPDLNPEEKLWERVLILLPAAILGYIYLWIVWLA
jgi:hypothetical protein